MRYLVVLLVLLYGCAPVRISPDAGTRFSVRHGTERFGDTMTAARQHYDKMGMRAVHIGSDRMGEDTSVSRFECVAR